MDGAVPVEERPSVTPREQTIGDETAGVHGKTP